MRLINTSSSPLVMEEFSEKEVPPYAILSHTWADQEVSYSAFNLPSSQTNLSGSCKINECSKLARARHLDYLWIDTCCIDKSSSAELSEAINSMWNWYAEAKECYVYLSDVYKQLDDSEAFRSDFKASRWFRRGWTLQELLAPKSVIFYDRDWKVLGTKYRLRDLVHEASGIEEHNFIHQPRNACIAKKMSWASQRETSRTEDLAYCLLGLFDINMPLLYGERHKAFQRLQQEIIRQSDDESIFAFKSLKPTDSMFAPSPTDFAHAGQLEIFSSPNLSRKPYVLTNKGLQFEILHHKAWQYDQPAISAIEKSIRGSSARFPVYVTPIRCFERGREDRVFTVHFGTEMLRGGELDLVRLVRRQLGEYTTVGLQWQSLYPPPQGQTFYIKV